MKKSAKSSKKSVILLALAAVLVVASSILFVGAVGGWFENHEKAVLSAEYTNRAETINITLADYQEMVKEKKSFIVITYLPSCTANILKYLDDFSKEKNIVVHYLSWAELRENQALKTKIQYAPSVLIVSKGEIIDFLHADSDSDTIKYNNYDEFSAWLQGKIDF